MNEGLQLIRFVQANEPNFNLTEPPLVATMTDSSAKSVGKSWYVGYWRFDWFSRLASVHYVMSAGAMGTILVLDIY
jgi:hypothetical protein